LAKEIFIKSIKIYNRGYNIEETVPEGNVYAKEIQKEKIQKSEKTIDK
jgi:hypothetical protein